MHRITRRRMLVMLSVVVPASSAALAQQRPKVSVYKDPTCGCCVNWVAHLRAHGFDAAANDVRDLAAVKSKYQVPASLRSCHTAVVDGYVIEGHVPAGDIQRLLKDRPKVLGLAVPGMPVGSPGMEGANGQRYNVLTFDASGRTAVYSTQEPSARPL